MRVSFLLYITAVPAKKLTGGLPKRINTAVSYNFLHLPMSVFAILQSTYPTWASLVSFLKSEDGGHLRIDDYSTPEQPFALIRYVKGKSNFSISHVRAFRSVVWDVIKNEPVSIAPQKSESGESMPFSDNASTNGYVIERFIDGVMICGFYDTYNNQWRFHTRSTLNANCRFYSQTKSFRQLFEEAVTATVPWNTFLSSLNTSVQYTWVLQHPENRIVSCVTTPKITCVQKQMYVGGTILAATNESTPFDVQAINVATWSELTAKLQLENAQFKHNFQGYIIKNGSTFRWKVRGEAYNRVRKLRGNSARRDYLWLSLWRADMLRDYLALYPEERVQANAIVERWKTISRTVYNLYVDVFKARSLPKAQIPPKYRPFVFGIHNLYINELKPQSKTVDWKTTLSYMNSRDTAQALYAINWEVRTQNQQQTIPLEAQTEAPDVLLDAVEPIPTAASNPPVYEAQPVTGVI